MGTVSSTRSSTISNPTESTKSKFYQKSCLITGASRGLGKSIAHALSSCHPSLLILSGRDEAALKEVQKECVQLASKEQSQGANSGTEYSSTPTTHVEIVVCDLADKHSVEQLAIASLNLAQKHGGDNIDILINNGGISSRSSFLQTDLEVDEKLMQVNFFAGVALAKKLVPGMVSKGTGGNVIWISSVQGKRALQRFLCVLLAVALV